MNRKFYFNCNLAGFTYWDGPFVFNELKVGTPLRLVYEPDNKFDPNAVAIYYNDSKIGYIPRDFNELIAPFLEMGHNLFEVVIQKIDPTAHTEHQIKISIYITKNNNDNK